MKWLFHRIKPRNAATSGLGRFIRPVIHALRTSHGGPAQPHARAWRGRSIDHHAYPRCSIPSNTLPLSIPANSIQAFSASTGRPVRKTTLFCWPDRVFVRPRLTAGKEEERGAEGTPTSQPGDLGNPAETEAKATIRISVQEIAQAVGRAALSARHRQSPRRSFCPRDWAERRGSSTWEQGRRGRFRSRAVWPKSTI